MISYFIKHLGVPNYMCQLITLYSTTVVAVGILITLSVSVACGEKGASKLKLIKHYFRNPINQIKFRNESIIFIKSMLGTNIGEPPLIKEFTKIKVRRVDSCS